MKSGSYHVNGKCKNNVFVQSIVPYVEMVERKIIEVADCFYQKNYLQFEVKDSALRYAEIELNILFKWGNFQSIYGFCTSESNCVLH